MRHAAGQRADGFHLLRLDELPLQLFLAGDIAHRRAAAAIIARRVVNRPLVDPDREDSAILANHLQLHFAQLAFAGRGGAQIGQFGAVLRRDQVIVAQPPHHLVAAVTQPVQFCLVHFQNETFRVGKMIPIRRVVVEVAVAGLGFPRLLQQPQVVQRQGQAVGKTAGDVRVLLGERLSAFLLRQVEPPIYFFSAGDRHAQKGLHRRMVGRKSCVARVLREVIEADRLPLFDQRAQQPHAPRQRADASDLFLGQPPMHKLDQAPFFVNQPDRPILRLYEVTEGNQRPMEGVFLGQRLAQQAEQFPSGAVEFFQATGAFLHLGIEPAIGHRRPHNVAQRLQEGEVRLRERARFTRPQSQHADDATLASQRHAHEGLVASLANRLRLHARVTGKRRFDGQDLAGCRDQTRQILAHAVLPDGSLHLGSEPQVRNEGQHLVVTYEKRCAIHLGNGQGLLHRSVEHRVRVQRRAGRGRHRIQDGKPFCPLLGILPSLPQTRQHFIAAAHDVSDFVVRHGLRRE